MSIEGIIVQSFRSTIEMYKDTLKEIFLGIINDKEMCQRFTDLGISTNIHSSYTPTMKYMQDARIVNLVSKRNAPEVQLGYSIEKKRLDSISIDDDGKVSCPFRIDSEAFFYIPPAGIIKKIKEYIPLIGSREEKEEFRLLERVEGDKALDAFVKSKEFHKYYKTLACEVFAQAVIYAVQPVPKALAGLILNEKMKDDDAGLVSYPPRDGYRDTAPPQSYEFCEELRMNSRDPEPAVIKTKIITLNPPPIEGKKENMNRYASELMTQNRVYTTVLTRWALHELGIDDDDFFPKDVPRTLVFLTKGNTIKGYLDQLINWQNNTFGYDFTQNYARTAQKLRINKT